jgi:hypothetical protein
LDAEISSSTLYNVTGGEYIQGVQKSIKDKNKNGKHIKAKNINKIKNEKKKITDTYRHKYEGVKRVENQQSFIFFCTYVYNSLCGEVNSPHCTSTRRSYPKQRR